MLEVQDGLPVGPGGALGGVGRGDAREDGDADAFFRADAERLGYLSRPHGMAEYYRDHGMLPPRYLDEGLRQMELTGLDLDRGL